MSLPFALLTFSSMRGYELTVVTLSVQISNNELDVHVDDSTVVLGYINSDVYRLKLFVANIVQQIWGHTIPKQWHYIGSSSNTSDDASQGLDSKKKNEIKRCSDSPYISWNRKKYWIEESQLKEVSDECLQHLKHFSLIAATKYNLRLDKV